MNDVPFQHDQAILVMDGKILTFSIKMKLALLVAFFTTLSLSASELRLTALHLPLYFHSDTDVKISDQPIPFVTSFASPEARLGAMSKPFIPHHDSSWNSVSDTNLVTIYGLALTVSQIEDSPDYLMVIDASRSKRPKGMPFTIKQVVEQTKSCATKNYPTSEKSKLRFSVIGLPKTELENRVPVTD